ncbi:RING-H2 finger protein ATL2-like [Lolium rigidum]|uniref:RING-H2 finger protein ATL2-like n=1 Tax=Lolium rigidum TaxID=89674 RepID=UPI001F5D3C65|nr:RING-H2 finger protein ATL2-like [Lolium rigidum]
MLSASTVLTLLGFCASVLFIVFVCSRLVCTLIRRLRRRPRRPSPPLPRFPPLAARAGYSSHILPGRQGHAAGSGGLDSAAVAAFPTRAFSSAGCPRGEAADDSAMCVVCLAEYEDADFLRVLPYCGHDFHVACVDIWLKQHSTCPVCRVSLRGNPGIKHAVPPRPSEMIVIPPCSPEVSGSDPCRCLFGGRGHSPRTSSEVLTNEPGQANQIQVVCHPPSEDRGNIPTPSEVRFPGENNNQTVKLNIECVRVVGIP